MNIADQSIGELMKIIRGIRQTTKSDPFALQYSPFYCGVDEDRNLFLHECVEEIVRRSNEKME